MPSITAANSIIIITCANLGLAFQVQGFAPDSIISVDDVDNAETQLGVDGFFTAGWVPAAARVGLTLSAASPSVSLFETIYASEEQIQDKYVLQGNFTFPSIGRSYTSPQGFLRGYKPFADAGKVLMPRTFHIEFFPMLPAAI